MHFSYDGFVTGIWFDRDSWKTYQCQDVTYNGFENGWPRSNRKNTVVFVNKTRRAWTLMKEQSICESKIPIICEDGKKLLVERYT